MFPPTQDCPRDFASGLRQTASDAPPTDGRVGKNERAMPNILRRAAIAAILPLIAVRTTSASSLPHLRVFKVTGCTCCDAWVSHLREAGIWARVSERPDLAPIRRAGGVPDDLAGCHTAFADGVIVEGHVPAAAVSAFLHNPGQWRGIAVAGMPIGSPGMEVLGQQPEAYQIWLFAEAGRRELFGHGVGTDVRRA